MAKHRRSRVELEAENAQLRDQVAGLQEALISALRLSQAQPVPLVKTDPVQWPWQQPGGGVLPGGVWIGDPPPGTGPQIWCQGPPSNISVSLYQSMGGFPAPEATEFYVGDISEQHDQP
jgi:hypothetical protein